MGQDARSQATISKLIARSWADPAFKARFKASPKDVLAEAGLAVPSNVKVNVVESTASEWTVVIPPVPAEGELSDEVLGNASGGISVNCCCCSC